MKTLLVAAACLATASAQFSANVWTATSKPAGFSPRADLASALLSDNKMYISGGWTGTSKTAFNDIWSSDTGSTWTQVNNNTAWSARFGHTMNAAGAALVLTGGEAADEVTVNNEVWLSTDSGITWAMVATGARWSARADHALEYAPFTGLSPAWVLTGGRTGSSAPAYFADTWLSSDNGVTWTQSSANSGWAGRSGHEMVYVPSSKDSMNKGEVWLLGGSANNFYSSNYFGDMWTTANGATWTGQGTNSFPARTTFGVAVYPAFGGADVSRIWITGGSDGTFFLNDVQFATPTVDGYMWQAAQFSTSFEQRVGLSVLTNSMGFPVVIGGLGNPDTILNGSQALTTFDDVYTATAQLQCFINSRKCNLDGVCNSATGACACNTGYSGATCGTTSCTPACENGGKCTDYNTCTCIYGYTGATCSGSNTTDTSDAVELAEEKTLVVALGAGVGVLAIGLAVVGVLYFKKQTFTKLTDGSEGVQLP
jgi:hypothetical protein